MKFTRPTDEQVRQIGSEDVSFIIPKEDIEINLEQITYTKQSADQDIADETPIISTTGGAMEIDLAALEKLCWEHKRYSSARGFSDSQMDVLRAVNEEGGNRVFTEEIMENKWAADYAKPTIYAALGELVDKGLLEKNKKGVYSDVSGDQE